MSTSGDHDGLDLNLAMRQNKLAVLGPARLHTFLLLILIVVGGVLALGAGMVLFSGLPFFARAIVSLMLTVGFPLTLLLRVNSALISRAWRPRGRRFAQAIFLMLVWIPVVFYASSQTPRGLTGVVGASLAVYQETLGRWVWLATDGPIKTKREIVKANKRILLACPAGANQRVDVKERYRDAYCLGAANHRHGPYMRMAGGSDSLPEEVGANEVLITGAYLQGQENGTWQFTSRQGVNLGQAIYENGELKSGMVIDVE